ncbi:hypothetical protein [Aestuariivirga sp.]|uniref:hypothetical protein n=1 Tax=Aestuariivirga sp. TaxID=2650926 RepID=UPI0025B9EAB0|nr:hypothetical protein [Aestuariivirga sp.]MCA3556498.1 hypothetical protein [Aestuariivirga sp.]
MERRVTTILPGDTAGCPRLMERDGAGAPAAATGGLKMMKRGSVRPTGMHSQQEFIPHDSGPDVLRGHPRLAAILKTPGDCE